MKTIIAQGAEAIIFLKNNRIIKNRISKGYRIPELDLKLRKQRTKKEIKLLNKCLQSNIPIPKVLSSTDFSITIQEIKGKKLSQYLDKLPNKYKISKQIGETIARIHDLNIIHGDLTTSNMILSKNKVYLIDFGLGFESQKIEDKATDIHVLKEALEAKHFQFSKKLWLSILEGYYYSKNSQSVLSQLKKVELRGRYKQSY